MLLIMLINILTMNNITANNINTHDKSGYTPLILSIIDKDINKTKELIKKGADVNLARDTGNLYHNTNPESGKTPLMYAVALKDIETVKLLIKYRAKVDKKNKMGATSLLFAIDSGNHDIVFYLYKKIKNKKDPKLLAQAVRNGDLELVNFFLNKKIPLTYKSKKDNILTLAIKSKNIEVVKKILEINKKLINEPNIDSVYPIMVAIGLGDYKIFNLLLTYPNINVSVKNATGQTVLHFASKRFKTDLIMKKLIDLKIDTNAVDQYGKTALFYLVQRENNNIIKYLIDKTDLSIRDKTKRTVYFYSVSNYNIFKLLMIKEKTSLIQKDNYGKSLLTYILDRGDYRVLKLFEQDLKEKKDSFKNQDILATAIRRGNYDMVNILLKAGFDVNGDRGRIPPIFKAIELNKVGILYLLLFYKANTNTYYNGRTAWSIAEDFNYLRALFLLRNFSFK